MRKNIVLGGALLALAGHAATASGADNGSAQVSSWPRDYFRCATTPAVTFQGTIVDAALATPDLKSLADAVVAAGHVETLNGRGAFTV